MAKTVAKKEVEKRPYSKDIKSKLKNGDSWKYHFEIDNDVALKIIEEKEASETGGEYSRIINSRLRKSYGIKKTKKTK